MKKVIEDLAVKFGCSTGYSGGRRIMYVHGERASEFVRHSRDKYPKLAFLLQVSEQPIPSGSLTTFTGTEVNKELAGEVADNAYKTVFGEASPLVVVDKVNVDAPAIGSVERTIDNVRIHSEEGTETFVKKESKEEKEKLRADVDAYLIANPIDKSKPGFYVPIAKQFGSTSDYIRKRYNSLKERGLVS